MAEQRRWNLARPKRRMVVIAVALGVVGIATGAASVLLDLGWALWVSALVAVGAAAIVALSGTRRLVLAGVAVFAVVVAGGVVWARSAPPLPPDTRSFSVFTSAGDGERLMDRDEDVFIVLNHEERAIVGFSAAGERLWASEEGYGAAAPYDVPRYAELTGESVIAFSGRGHPEPAVLLSAETGEVEWTADVGETEAFTANDDVIVFSDSDRTLALDRRTGERRWELDAEAVSSSKGEVPPYDWHRWVPHADWLVVGDRDLGTYQVIDARSGEPALEFELERPDLFGRWVIAGDTFVTFGNEADGRPVAKGSPLAGGRPWTTDIHQPGHSRSYYDAVGDRVRIVGDYEIQWLDAVTGERTIIEVPEQWSIGTGGYDPDGARTLVAKDRNGSIRRVALFDSITGELTELPGPHAPGAHVQRGTEAGTLILLPYLDAVGDEHERLVLIPD